MPDLSFPGRSLNDPPVILGTYALRGGKKRRTSIASIAAIVVGSAAILGYLIVYLEEIIRLSLGLS